MESEQWKADVLLAHNTRRQLHGSRALAWSDECFEEARRQANACQSQSSAFYGHMSGSSGSHGQNIFGCGAQEPSVDEAVSAWYGESKDYDYSLGGLSSRTGCFTQMLWKGATSVGMAVSDNGLFLVANYFPVGNTLGDFQINVLPVLPSSNTLHATPTKGRRKMTQPLSAGSPLKIKRRKGYPVSLKSPIKCKQKRKAAAPVCSRPGCSKPTWNGRPGEYCTKTQVWSASFASCHHLFQ